MVTNEEIMQVVRRKFSDGEAFEPSEVASEAGASVADVTAVLDATVVAEELTVSDGVKQCGAGPGVSLRTTLTSDELIRVGTVADDQRDDHDTVLLFEVPDDRLDAPDFTTAANFLAHPWHCNRRPFEDHGVVDSQPK